MHELISNEFQFKGRKHIILNKECAMRSHPERGRKEREHSKIDSKRAQK